MHRRHIAPALASIVIALVSCPTSVRAQAAGGQAAGTPTQVLITNVRVFDGLGDRLAEGMNMLVEGNRIARLSRSAIAVSAGATVIDAKGRTLMPGLIDAHTHLMFESVPQAAVLTADIRQRRRRGCCARHAAARLHQRT
ncbi:MAG TPA: amidohydrolase family protein [Rubrivivax sp.]|nr:amidohydrolase family protein [Rubrivivax sp.]